MKRRLKVTVTRIRRQTVMAVAATSFRARRAVRRHEAEVLTAAEMLRFLEIENQTLENLIAVGKIHVTETVSGSLCFCKDSLFLN